MILKNLGLIILALAMTGSAFLISQSYDRMGEAIQLNAERLDSIDMCMQKSARLIIPTIKNKVKP